MKAINIKTISQEIYDTFFFDDAQFKHSLTEYKRNIIIKCLFSHKVKKDFINFRYLKPVKIHKQLKQ